MASPAEAARIVYALATRGSIHYLTLHSLTLATRVCRLSHFSHSQLFAAPWSVPSRLLCPWDSPGKDTEVCSCALLQGTFPTQGSPPVSYVYCIGRQVLSH